MRTFRGSFATPCWRTRGSTEVPFFTLPRSASTRFVILHPQCGQRVRVPIRISWSELIPGVGMHWREFMACKAASRPNHRPRPNCRCNRCSGPRTNATSSSGIQRQTGSGGPDSDAPMCIDVRLQLSGNPMRISLTSVRLCKNGYTSCRRVDDSEEVWFSPDSPRSRPRRNSPLLLKGGPAADGGILKARKNMRSIRKGHKFPARNGRCTTCKDRFRPK